MFCENCIYGNIKLGRDESIIFDTDTDSESGEEASDRDDSSPKPKKKKLVARKKVVKKS